MTKYWENQSGYYDPVATEVIDNESSRSKLVHDTIREVKNMLKDRDMELGERIVVRDKKTKKIWR